MISMQPNTKWTRCVDLSWYMPMSSRYGHTVDIDETSALLSGSNLTTTTVRDNSRDVTGQLMTIVRHITSSAHGQGEVERINPRRQPPTEFADNQTVGFSATPSHLFVFDKLPENSLVPRCRCPVIPHVPNNKRAGDDMKNRPGGEFNRSVCLFPPNEMTNDLWKHRSKDRRENSPIKSSRYVSRTTSFNLNPKTTGHF